MVAFISRAKSGDSIHGAVYEFQWPDVLAALKEAKRIGVTVKVIFDDVQNTDSDGVPLGPWKPNEDAIALAQIKSITKGRQQAKLMHNKFFVLSKGSQPAAVWTGSTNITENGIFGHANVGHIVEDKTIAKAYLNYYDRLFEDPDIAKDYRDENMSASPVPHLLPKGTTPIFSPRGTALDALTWYAELAQNAKDALLMTFAFGMQEKFKAVYRTDDDLLRMALMEKAFASPIVKERDEKDIQEIRNRPNVVVAIGNRIVTNAFDRWLKEMYSVDGKGKHVYWIHTKFMLVDPLGDEPVVITGSANFSKASTDTNDENMLVIKGDKRIADIYFGEYMRLYSHYAFREAVKWAMEKEKLGLPQNWTPQYLIDKDTWMKDYFSPNDKTGRRVRRTYFSGPMSV
jgi:phosphatidylserine/phosphatidylglycerophosphate/cardiolipin synthase-like enzyme